MTEPNLSALTKMEQLVFGADAKKDADGNIIEQGHGNLHDRVKKVEAALKAAVPNIAPETVANLAQSAVIQSVGVPVQTVPAAPVTPAPVTPAPVAVAPTPLAATVVGAPTPAASVAPVAPVVPAPTVAAVVEEVAPTTTVPTPVVAAVAQTVVAQAAPAETHASLVAKVKALLAGFEAKVEEIL